MADMTLRSEPVAGETHERPEAPAPLRELIERDVRQWRML